VPHDHSHDHDHAHTHLIGISGGSGSGKSTLASLVSQRLGAESAPVFAFDTYYRDHSHLTVEERAKVNYDHPDSLDVELFTTHLDQLRAGGHADTPVYDFASHTRVAETRKIGPAHLVIVEGILLFSFPEICERLDLRVFRDCPENERFERRLRRDVAERGRSPESVKEQWATTVSPMHNKYVQPTLTKAQIVIEHGEDLHQVADLLATHIHGMH
jgi:uridine kinase